jgi:hypothetical protein
MTKKKKIKKKFCLKSQLFVVEKKTQKKVDFGVCCESFFNGKKKKEKKGKKKENDKTRSNNDRNG